MLCRDMFVSCCRCGRHQLTTDTFWTDEGRVCKGKCLRHSKKKKKAKGNKLNKVRSK